MNLEQFLEEENNQYLLSSNNYILSSNNNNHRLWLSKKVEDRHNIKVVNNHYLLVKIGKSLVKTDITKSGDWFSYGDGEEMNYDPQEIESWKKTFVQQFLLPLEQEIIEKYKLQK